MTSQDRFASFDAAYVLGALSPKDRQEFEQHLRECADCATAVRELAGMPGLLSRVPLSMLPTEAELPAPPEDLLPRLLDRVRFERLRRRVITIGTSALAAAACLALVLMIVFRPVIGEQPTAVPTATMSPVSNAPVWATIGLKEVGWGTKIDMHCMYEQRPGWTKSGVYLLVVVPKQGKAETISTWQVFPGKDARFQAATSHPINEIAAIEVRSSYNKTVLRINP